MARGHKTSGWGKPFVAAVDVRLGVTAFDALQSGQWVRLGKHTARLVKNRDNGEHYFVTRKGRKPLSMNEFRLACGVPVEKVEPAAV